MNLYKPEGRFAKTLLLLRLLGLSTFTLILLFGSNIEQALSAGSQQADLAYLRQAGSQGYKVVARSRELDKKSYLCIGERINIVVKVFLLDPEAFNPGSTRQMWQQTGGFPVSVLITGGTGVTIPADKAYFDFAGPLGRAAIFTFIAQKVGQEKIVFETIGPDEGGDFPVSGYAQDSLEFEVRDCLYDVYIVSRWTGLGRNHVAIVDDAPLAVDPSSPRHFTGAGEVRWLVTEDNPPPNCPPHTETFTSTVGLFGSLDESGNNLTVAVNYGQAGGEWDYSECGYRELMSFTPADLEGSIPAWSGGTFSNSQVLADSFTSAMDVPGSADVIVIPKSDPNSSLYQNPGPSLARLAGFLAVALILPIKEKRPIVNWKWPFVLLLILVIAAGCGQQPSADNASTELAFDPEQFEFFDPTVGLSQLSSYRATLTLTFDGMHGGQLEQWTRTYKMLVSQSPALRQLTMQSSGPVAEPADLWMAEQEGVLYELDPQGGCQASAAPQGGLLSPEWEPIRFLPMPGGAGEAGSDTINGIVASHYTFDEGAIGASGRADSAGEAWLSDQSYIVKYLLTTEATPGYFGEDVEGTLTYEYDLTDIDQPVTITLPEDCSPGLLNAPLMQNAEDVKQFPTVTQYLSPSSVAEVVAFYEQQFPAVGWQLSDDPVVTETFGTLEFIKSNQALSVIALSNEQGTSVLLLLDDA